MNPKIQTHVDELFLGIPHTKEAAEIKEELLSNLGAKYADLISAGKTDEEAFGAAVSGIGDIRGLLGYESIREVRTVRGKSSAAATLKTAGIMFILISAAAIVIGYNAFNASGTALSLFGGFILLGIGLLIYGSYITPPKYKREDDTFVEEFKEEVSDSGVRKRFNHAVTSTLWILIVIMYLGVSFLSGAWHLTWLIFPVGAIVNNLLLALLGDRRAAKGLLVSCLWLSATVLFFLLGFLLNAWAWCWLVFLVAALAQQMAKLIRLWGEMR